VDVTKLYSICGCKLVTHVRRILAQQVGIKIARSVDIAKPKLYCAIRAKFIYTRLGILIVGAVPVG
jgi:hypothetical protein